MKRDMNLVRAILLAVESCAEPYVSSASLPMDDWDRAAVLLHLDLMIDAGLIDGEFTEYSGGIGDAYVRRLTWDGYDFLDNVRNEEVWAETRSTIGSKLGSASFDVVKAVASALALKALGL